MKDLLKASVEEFLFAHIFLFVCLFFVGVIGFILVLSFVTMFLVGFDWFWNDSLN